MNPLSGDPPGWSWRAGPGGPSVAVGASLAATPAWDSLHVFTARPDGGAVAHAALAADAAVSILHEVPLRSVSGAAALRDHLVVAGAHLGDDAPAAWLIGRDGHVARLVKLAADGQLAAWPVPVSTETDVNLVWATGVDPATVWVGRLEEGRVTRAPAFHASGIAFLRAIAWRGSIDLLCYDSGLKFARWAEGRVQQEQILEVASASAAELVPGAVLSPVQGHSYRVWEPDTGAIHELILPEPPEGLLARARRPRLVPGAASPELLLWETESPDDHRVDDVDRPVHVLDVRAWVAQLDRDSWTVGPAHEVPGPGAPAAIAWLGGRLVVARVGGGILDAVVGVPLT